MKVVTNILLVAALIVYVFLPLFEVEFEGGMTEAVVCASAVCELFRGNSI